MDRPGRDLDMGLGDRGWCSISGEERGVDTLGRDTVTSRCGMLLMRRIIEGGC